MRPFVHSFLEASLEASFEPDDAPVCSRSAPPSVPDSPAEHGTLSEAC